MKFKKGDIIVNNLYPNHYFYIERVGKTRYSITNLFGIKSAELYIIKDVDISCILVTSIFREEDNV